MTIAQHDVLAIAHLARLGLSADALPGMVNELTAILGLFTALEQADTTGCDPMSHPLDLTQRVRPDMVTEQDQRDLFLQNAPSQEAGLFLVPSVIESTT